MIAQLDVIDLDTLIVSVSTVSGLGANLTDMNRGII